ncbi:MAG TPA: choice-of-anchor Q domain-containing protein, partial [Anaerolineae bacterium]
DSGTSCGFGSVSGSMSNTDPKLAPLGHYGGPTKTMALLKGSPAIDAVLTGCPPPSVDQRGVSRPQGAHCDIGAFEAALFWFYLPVIMK